MNTQANFYSKIAALSAAFMLWGSTISVAQATVNNPTASYIVRVTNDSAADIVAGAMRSEGVSRASASKGAIDFVEATLTATEAAEWALRIGVSYIEENHIILPAVDQPIPAPVGSDWANAGNWGLDRIDQRSLPLDQTYRQPSTGVGVNIYVIDTGINRMHSEFAGRVDPVGLWAIGEFITTAGPFTLTNTDDGCGHGTHVAGIAAGATFGVAKGATIIPVRIFPGGSEAICNAGTTVGAAVNAVNQVVDHHLPGVPAVANLSLGVSSQNTALDEAVGKLIADGITVVVAAGNSAKYLDSTIPANADTPACTPGTITVGASGKYSGYSLASPDTEAIFSNYGKCVDILAPGTHIKSAWPTLPAIQNDPVAGEGTLSNSAWALSSGTSMASPFVAGAAARILETSPASTPTQVGQMIVLNATSGVLTFVNGIGAPDTQSPNLLLSMCASVCFPGAPQSVIATRGDGRVPLVWAAPQTDGGSPVLAYTATATSSTSSSLPPEGLTCTATAPATTCTIANLVNGTTYSFEVVATNAIGRGPTSTAISAIPATVPSSPTAPSLISGDRVATISWTTTANGGAGITSYVVTASPGGESCATNGELTCVVRGLANGTSYTFSLVAINDMGASATSPASGAVAPSATWVVGPFALSTLAGYKSVTVSWGAATLSSGEAVGYVLRAVDGRVVCTTTAVSCKVRELVNGRTSQFTIEATSITTSAPVVATRKVVVGGLVQKANSMKRRSTALLSKVASTFSKGNVTWVVVKGKCRISGKYIYAPSTKGTCVLRVSVAKKAPFPAQKMTINLRVI